MLRASQRRREFILALDEGTTNTKALLIDVRDGSIVSSCSARLSIGYPSPGCVEQDSQEILRRTLDVASQCLSGIDPEQVLGISVSNQRETVVAWDSETGEPIGPALGWQDSRTSGYCEALQDAQGEVRARTGLVLDPMFSAPKMRYLLDAAIAKGVPFDRVRLGTIDTWLLLGLTGVPLAEAGNASRTMLFSLETLDWDPVLLEVFGIPLGSLATVARSDADFGVTVEGLPIPAGIPVISVLGDSHAALFFHTSGKPGLAKTTYGTGSSIMVASPVSNAPDGVAATLAWLGDRPSFAREGNILTSGATFTWVAGLLTGGDVRELDRLAAQADHTDVVLVPAFSGLGAPYFDRRAQGLITGITGGTRSEDIALAALEAVANQVADVVVAMESDGAVAIEGVRADGAPTASEPLMQLQADLLGKPIDVASRPEASCLGAAMFGVEARYGSSTVEAWSHQREIVRSYSPAIAEAARQADRSKWFQGVERSRFIPA